jgi:hypothetical protein
MKLALMAVTKMYRENFVISHSIERKPPGQYWACFEKTDREIESFG